MAKASKQDILKDCLLVAKDLAISSAKDVAASEVAISLSEVLRKHLGKRYPAVLKSIPYFSEVEPLLLSCIIYGGCEVHGSDKAKTLSKVAQRAISGEFHRILRPVIGGTKKMITSLLRTSAVKDLLKAEEE